MELQSIITDINEQAFGKKKKLKHIRAKEQKRKIREQKEWDARRKQKKWDHEATTMMASGKTCVYIESRHEMFEIGKGKRFHKKPGSGGAFTPNTPLRGMAMSSLNYELNRPMRAGICIAK